jgi:hypothetical protein
MMAERKLRKREFYIIDYMYPELFFFKKRLWNA